MNRFKIPLNIIFTLTTQGVQGVSQEAGREQGDIAEGGRVSGQFNERGAQDTRTIFKVRERCRLQRGTTLRSRIQVAWFRGGQADFGARVCQNAQA